MWRCCLGGIRTRPSGDVNRRQCPRRARTPNRAGRGRAPLPVQLTGELTAPLSRWLWLVKWVLAIPHYAVLAFLWIAFVLTTIVAGFAILFTGRYPRSLFAFNVGVMRWSWRVGFYAHSALGTDQYPPFSLARTDYPADLDVDYPERLSRGLVLVKSWLLAIPQLIIVGLLTAPWYWVASGAPTEDYQRTVGISLLGLLVLVAGLALLFTGRYPPSLFGLIMGINRWVYRVTAYVALMRDEYPPFRLDQGAMEPDAARDRTKSVATAADEPSAVEGPRPPGRHHRDGWHARLGVVGHLSVCLCSRRRSAARDKTSLAHPKCGDRLSWVSTRSGTTHARVRLVWCYGAAGSPTGAGGTAILGTLVVVGLLASE